MPRLTLLFLLAPVALAQPRVTGLQNNYSYLLPNTPNYGIAQGSIFVLYGQGLAAPGVNSQGFNPTLARTLGGTTLRVRSGNTTLDAIPYYVSPNQIAAILPSALPPGAATLTVIYNGATSPDFPFTIAQSAFGILTLGGNGLGNAAVFDTDYNYITPIRPARPGQTLIFWGTGQGPDPNDETRLIPNPQNLSNLPFEFYIANKPARVIYHGRSTYPGLDQIIVEVPAGVTGCYASAYAKTGNLISNFVSLPVSENGGPCADWFSNATEVQSQLGTGKTELNMSWLYLAKFKTYTPAIGATPASLVTQDAATAQFTRYTPFDASNWGSVGGFSNPGCIVTVFNGTTPFSAPKLLDLEAGEPVTLTLPEGATRNLVRQGVSNHSLTASDSIPGQNQGLFIQSFGGPFRFRAPGSTIPNRAVGPIDATITVNDFLIWNEQTTIRAVPRNQPLTLTWRGTNQPILRGGFIIIQGGSFSLNAAGTGPAAYTAFGCTIASEAGTFTIPRDILASMLPSATFPFSPTTPTGTLLVQYMTLPARFTATGLDHGSITWQSYSATSVHYQ